MNGVVTRTGVITAVSGGRAVIAVDAGGCSSCGAKRECRVGKLAAVGGGTRIEVAAPTGMTTGTTVLVDIAEDRLPGFAAAGYLLPAVTLLIGAGLGEFIAATDAAAALGACAGLAAGLLATRRVARHLPELRVRRTPGRDTEG